MGAQECRAMGDSHDRNTLGPPDPSGICPISQGGNTWNVMHHDNPHQVHPSDREGGGFALREQQSTISNKN